VDIIKDRHQKQKTELCYRPTAHVRASQCVHLDQRCMQIVKLLVDTIPRSDQKIEHTYQYENYPALNVADHKFNPSASPSIRGIDF
jgi:hypothetical protein